jgi:hypothetical protein
MADRWHARAWLLGAALLVSCAKNTEVVNSWKDPNASSVHFKKVVVLYMSSDSGVRRSVEGQVASQLPKVVPAYKVLSDADLKDSATVKARLREAGVDGAVRMRLNAVDKQFTYVPGQAYVVPPAYGSMWGYWGYGWGTAYSPGYVTEDQVVNMEMNVYSLPDTKLLWASRTQTDDPKSVSQLIHEIVKANVDAMKQEKVIASTAAPNAVTVLARASAIPQRARPVSH